MLRTPPVALGALALFALTSAPTYLSGQASKKAPAVAAPALTQILSSELKRNLDGLSKAEPAAYYISYEVTDVDSREMSASLGSLLSSSGQRRRRLDCSVRVGSPEFDNYRVTGSDRQTLSTSAELPIEDDEAAIRRIVWRETDRAWRIAARRYVNARSSANLATEAAKTADFSAEKSVTGSTTAAELKFNAQEWENRIRKQSAAAGVFGVITSTVSLNVRRDTRTFVDSEGTAVSHGRNFARWGVISRAKLTTARTL